MRRRRGLVWVGAGTRLDAFFLIFFPVPMRRRTSPALASWAVGGRGGPLCERERVGGGLVRAGEELCPVTI